MNKKSLLVVGLLFSLGSVFAEEPETPVSLQSLYNEADKIQAKAIANAVVLGNEDMTSLFEGVPSEKKDVIYGYVLEAMREMEDGTADKDDLINAVERRAYFQNKKSSITGPGEPTRIEQAKAFALENKQSIAVGVSAFVFGYWMNSGRNPTLTIEEIRDAMPAEATNQQALDALRDQILAACTTYVAQDN